jgi:hypothetical protein
MDEATKAHLDAMEARLMGRLNGLEERMIERFRAVDLTLAAHTGLMHSHTEMTRSTNMLLEMLVNNNRDHGKRITDLENKP